MTKMIMEGFCTGDNIINVRLNEILDRTKNLIDLTLYISDRVHIAHDRYVESFLPTVRNNRQHIAEVRIDQLLIKE